MKEMQRFLSVPKGDNHQGKERQVGFEMEYTGLNLSQTSDLIVSLFGGNVTRKNAFVQCVENTRIGDIDLELDMPLLKDEVYKKYLDALGIVLDGVQMASIEQLLDDAASAIVPYELVLPPLPLGALEPVELLREKMCEAGAEGTQASVTYAFGLHINAELPGVEVGVLRRYLQAFLLLEDWIREQSHIDWTRRLTPFINPFPKDYHRLILRSDYRPNWDVFLADYLAYNNTRYRSLDLLPALAWIDLDGLRKAFPDADKIGARPTFHYRLPNCLLGDPQWRVSDEWYYWALVERLAEDLATLDNMIQAYEMSPDALVHQRTLFLRQLDV